MLRLLFARGAEPVMDASAFSFNSPAGACPACHGLGQTLAPNPDRLFEKTKSLTEGAIQHRAWKVKGRYWNIIKATGLFPMDVPLAQWPAEKLNRLMHAPPAEVANHVPGFVQRFTFEGVVRRLRDRLADERGLDSADYDAQFFTTGSCPTCAGARLRPEVLACRVGDMNIAEAARLSLSELKKWVEKVAVGTLRTIGESMLRILDNLELVELGFMTLDRPMVTLSGGEMQRVKIARELGSRLTGLLYILDEPSRGLHANNVRIVNRIISSLRDRGNTVLSVEHNRLVVEQADHLIEIGPGPGRRGGRITAEGSPGSFRNHKGPTARLLFPAMSMAPRLSRQTFTQWHRFRNLRLHNLQVAELAVPCAAFTCLVGVSGAGKSSILEEIQGREPGSVRVAQQQIGASVRSNVCTYLDFFDEIRNLFARASGAPASVFAFNSEGACAECGGRGTITLDLHFLGQASAACRTCQGQRYRPEVLKHRYQGRNIAEVLALSIEEAQPLLAKLKKAASRLELLVDAGLGYVPLGQSLDTFSGGELQRVKLIYGLSEGTSVYLLDEPSRGLHPDDCERLAALLRSLTARGKTVIASEHSLELVARADYLVEIGPGAAAAGGKIVAAGTAAELAESGKGLTAKLLQTYAPNDA